MSKGSGDGIVETNRGGKKATGNQVERETHHWLFQKRHDPLLNLARPLTFFVSANTTAPKQGMVLTRGLRATRNTPWNLRSFTCKKGGGGKGERGKGEGGGEWGTRGVSPRG